MNSGGWQPWLGLALAEASLFVGPALAAGTSMRWSSLIDGFVLTSILALVGLHLFPQVFAELGLWALAAAVAGFALPALLHGIGRGAARLEGAVLGLAAFGLGVHAALDGAALAATAHARDYQPVVWAVALHRVPVGLFVWWTIRPRAGPRWATLALLAIGLATLGGFGLAAPLEGMLGVPFTSVVVAFVSGSLLHVLVDHGPTRNPAPSRRLELLGGVLGLATVGAGEWEHHFVQVEPFARAFLALALDAAPALLAGYLLAGLIKSFVPPSSMAWLARGSTWSQAARGTLFGAPLPICSCSVLPVYKGLVDGGVPTAAAVAFLVATPELGIETIFLSVSLLGRELTAARVVAAVATSLIVGVLVGNRWPTVSTDVQASKSPVAPTFKARLVAAARFGLGEVVVHTAAWIVLGLMVAAAIPHSSLGPWLSTLPPWMEVPLFAVVSVPLYVCASGATPLAAGLWAGGASPGAVLAFLLAGPATNLTTFGVLGRLHGRRASLFFAATMIGLACGAGILVNLAFARGAVEAPQPVAHAHGVLSWTCLVLLTAIFARSVAVQGIRGVLRGLFHVDTPGSAHDHGHHHGHHGHAHDELTVPRGASETSVSTSAHTG